VLVSVLFQQGETEKSLLFQVNANLCFSCFTCFTCFPPRREKKLLIGSPAPQIRTYMLNMIKVKQVKQYYYIQCNYNNIVRYILFHFLFHFVSVVSVTRSAV
jgi:hypothetical protein